MSVRKILFWIHLTIGSLAGMVILIMSVTGVLLMYQRQVTNWFDRDLRATSPRAGAVRLPMETMLAEILSRKGTTPSAITLRADPAAPAEVSYGRNQVFFVNPYTGSVLGEGSRRVRSFFRAAEDWHRWLGANGDHRAAARAVTGACNLGFLFLVITGPFLWIPRKWSWQSVRAVFMFRRGLSGRAQNFNWHNVIGIWCAAPLFLIVISGVVMSYPWANNLLYRVTGNDPPAQGTRQRRGAARRQAQHSGRDAAGGRSLAASNALWMRAAQQVPNWQSLTLRLPASRGAMIFTIDTGSGGRPDQRAQLTLNARTAELVRWEPFSSNNAGRRLRAWFRFLHTGEAGGIAGQTVAGIVTAGAAMLVWTGIFLAFRRLFSYRKCSKKQLSTGLPEQDYAVSTKG
jgi:uncharacterized iron-regulated membrane protein